MLSIYFPRLFGDGVHVAIKIQVCIFDRISRNCKVEVYLYKKYLTIYHNFGVDSNTLFKSVIINRFHQKLSNRVCCSNVLLGVDIHITDHAVKVGSGFEVALGKHYAIIRPTVRCKADTYIQQQGPINRGKCVKFNQ